jgi:hypothetical protein
MRAGVPVGAGRAVPLALSRYHHTVWPLGEVAPVGGQARMRRSPDGYLWLESRAGPVRFDGVRYVGPHRDGAGHLWVTVDSSGSQRAGGRLVDGRLLSGTRPAGAPRAAARDGP